MFAKNMLPGRVWKRRQGPLPLSVKVAALIGHEDGKSKGGTVFQ